MVQAMQDETRRILRLFVEKADRLLSLSFTKFISEQGNGVELEFQRGEGIRITRNAPDDEAVEAFVLTLRLFILRSEPLSLVGNRPGMGGVIADAGLSQRFRDKVAETITQMNAYLDRTPDIVFEIDGHRPTRREILDVFLNGGLAHSNNAERREAYERWRRNPLAFPLHQMEFYSILSDLLQGIALVNGWCRDELAPPRGLLQLAARHRIARRRQRLRAEAT